MTYFINDLKYGLRMLAKSPGFTTVAIVSLALGITLNSAIFSVVDGMWLRSMPFADPARVVRLFAGTPQYQRGGLSFPDYLDLREQMQSLLGLATVDRRGAHLAGEEGPEMLSAHVVSRSFFTVLGIRPYLGRFFLEEDDPAIRNTPVVVLSYRLWKRRFGGDTSIVGKPIELTARSVIVMGIAPPAFYGLERLNPADVWYPEETWGEDRTSREDRWLSVVGRLKPGYTVPQAQAEAETIFRRLDLRDAASGAALRALVLTEARLAYLASGGTGLSLMGLVGMILLIACANVAGLLLARAEVRGREIAVRTALGGRRLRLIRQLLTECLLLALIAAIISLLFARWIISTLPALLPSYLGRVALLVRLDARVVAFTAAVSLLTVFLFGLAPALHISRPNIVPVLNGNVDLSRLGRKRSGLNALVIGQMSLALVLVLAATVMTRSLLKYLTADVGFDKRDILLVRLGASDNADEGRLFYRELKERVLALPGVKQVSVARVAPFSPSGTGASKMVFLAEGRPSTGPQDQADKIRFNTVDVDYFRLLGIPLLRGRTFTDHDDKSSAKVMVINDMMAKTFWPNEDPIDKYVQLAGTPAEPVQIIGVVQDSRWDNVEEQPEPHLYLTLSQEYSWEAILLARAALDPITLVRPVRVVLKDLGVTPSRSDVSTMAQYIRAKFVEQEDQTKMLVFLGLLGLGLASLGLYGVLAYAVNRRTQEIGIRMALGARRGDILRTVVWRGCSLVLVGAMIGLPIALAVVQILRGSVYAVRPIDPASIGVSLIVLLAVALLASYLPARRAARIDPMVALRYE